MFIIMGCSGFGEVLCIAKKYISEFNLKIAVSSLKEENLIIRETFLVYHGILYQEPMQLNLSIRSASAAGSGG